MQKQSEWAGILVALSAAAVFGIYPTAVHQAYDLGANAMFMVLMSLWGRAASMAVFCLVTGKKLYATRAATKQGLSNGFFQCLSVIGINGGIAFLPGAVVITTMFSYVLLLYIFLLFKGDEKFDGVTLLTVAAALVGLAFVLDVFNASATFSWAGAGLAVMAAIVTAARMYFFGKQLSGGKSNPIVVGSETFLWASLLGFFACFFFTPQWPSSAAGWGWIALSLVSNSAGTFCMFYGIAMLGSFKYSFFAKLEPVFTAILAALVIGQILTTEQYIGIATVIGSLLVYQARQQKLKARAGAA